MLRVDLQGARPGPDEEDAEHRGEVYRQPGEIESLFGLPREGRGAAHLCYRAADGDLKVEAASHGRTVFDYNLFSKGARSYGELVREVLYGRSTAG